MRERRPAGKSMLYRFSFEELSLTLEMKANRTQTESVCVCVCVYYSNHMTLNIEPAVAAVLAVFTAVMGVACMPRFKLHGGTVRENLALQNLQVSYINSVICALHLLAYLLAAVDKAPQIKLIRSEVGWCLCTVCSACCSESLVFLFRPSPLIDNI